MMGTLVHFGHFVWPQLPKNISKQFNDALFLTEEKFSLYFLLLLGAYTREFQFLDFVNFQCNFTLAVTVGMYGHKC